MAKCRNAFKTRRKVYLAAHSDTYLLVRNQLQNRVRDTTTVERADGFVIDISKILVVQNVEVLQGMEQRVEYVGKTGLITHYGGVGEIDINPSVFHRDDRNKAMLDNPSTTYAVSITLTSEQFPSTRRAADTMLKNLRDTVTMF